jgi:hypothetical protein
MSRTFQKIDRLGLGAYCYGFGAYQEWTSRGLLVLTPEQTDTPVSLHEGIFNRCNEITKGGWV